MSTAPAAKCCTHWSAVSRRVERGNDRADDRRENGKDHEQADSAELGAGHGAALGWHCGQ